MASFPQFLPGVAILGAVVLALIFPLVGGWLRRHHGARALAIATAVALGALIVGLIAFAVTGGAPSSPPALNIAAHVPDGSRLYFARYGQGSAGQIAIVRLDARTGVSQWQVALPLGRPTIAVSDGALYASGGQEVWALRGIDGAQLWHTTLTGSGVGLPGQPASAFPTASPVVADGVVYISLDTQGGADQGQVVALRASDGSPLWSRAFDDYNTSENIEPLAAGDGLVFVSSVGDGIRALHAADGSLAWQAAYPGDVQLLGGFAYVSSGAQPIVALDEHTGALVWSLPCWRQDGVAFTASGARLYVTGLDLNVNTPGEWVYAFDTQQRQLLWKYAAVNVFTPPAIAGDLVFVGHGTTLDAVRASDGKRVWTQEAEEPNAGPVALATIGDTLYMRVHLIYPHVLLFGCGVNCKQSYSLSAVRISDGAAYWRHYEAPDAAPWLVGA